MTDETHPFVPGSEVMVQRDYSCYGHGTFKPDTVLKVHKTGRFTLASDPKQQWEARKSGSWGETDKTWFAYPTGRTGYSIYSTRLRLMDVAAKAEYEIAKAKDEHEKRCETIVDTFTKAAKVTHELSAQIAALLTV